MKFKTTVETFYSFVIEKIHAELFSEKCVKEDSISKKIKRIWNLNKENDVESFQTCLENKEIINNLCNKDLPIKNSSIIILSFDKSATEDIVEINIIPNADDINKSNPLRRTTITKLCAEKNGFKVRLQHEKGLVTKYKEEIIDLDSIINRESKFLIECN